MQFENLTTILKLPGKKTFNNMDREFLEKRKKDLNGYLQVNKCPEVFTLELHTYPVLRDLNHSVCQAGF